MNLVIPLKNDGNYDQLRFALRSITAHHDITNCILVGGKPAWYTGSHIPHRDYSPQFKEANIRDKVLAGAATITGEFLMAHDDHLILQPITKVYNKGLLSDNIKRRIGNGSYTRCLRNTFEHYGDVVNTDCHCPMWMDADKVQATNFEWPEYGIGFKTCYCQENRIESEYMEDCKTNTVPSGREWFSLVDGFPLRQLVNIFPQACKFEKEYVP